MSCGIPGVPGPSCNEDADLIIKATIEAAQLTDKEREIILAVITKDELLSRQQQLKVMQLKAELQQLRRKGAIKVSTDFDSTGPDPDRSCGRCRVELGRVINRGAYCRSCRLKVCKACREFNFRATDWVCTVCHKRMEIQAASGEWMNKLATNKRSNTKVYVPAADIIKRTIRRSWTISNPIPAPRWNAIRGTPEIRPYNSMPRGQDLNNYPTLALYQAQFKSSDSDNKYLKNAKRSPTRRTQSEDVYSERNEAVFATNPNNYERAESTRNASPVNKTYSPDPLNRSIRINPLMQLASNKENKERRHSPKRKSQLRHGSKESELSSSSTEKIDKSSETSSPLRHSSDDERSSQEKPIEKHVSFDYNQRTSEFIARTRSLSQSKPRARKMPVGSRSLPEEGTDKDETSSEQNHRYDLTSNPVELCDIEPLSGTVFRKMTVRRRRQENMRKMAAVDAGWRRTPDADFFDFLLPDGEDWRLVFVSNSDSSSKEEDDVDSSSASSFPIDECDWDYFEPGARTQPLIGWGSPFGSPIVYRKRLIDSPLGSPLLQRRRIIREYSDDDRNSASSPSDALFNPPPPFENHAVPSHNTELKKVHATFDEKLHNYESKGQQESTTSFEGKVPSGASVGGTPSASGTPGSNNDDPHGCMHRHCRNDSLINSTVSAESPSGARSSSTGSCNSCGCTANSNNHPQFIPIPVPVPIPFPVPWNTSGALSDWNDSSGNLSPLVLYKSLSQRNDWWKYLGQVPPFVWPLLAGNGTPMINHDEPPQELSKTAEDGNVENTEEKKTEFGGKRVEEEEIISCDVGGSNEDLISDNRLKEGEGEEPRGHLDCENRPPSDCQSSTSSDSSDDDHNANVDQPRVRRVYNVSGPANDRESDDALPSSNVTSDGEEPDGQRSSPDEHEDTYSSSGSADTDSNDTGTVADQKPKKFSRVFVVNHKGLNSSSSEDNSSSSNDEDSSDNDTDTELDCTVILTNVKQFDSEENNSREERNEDNKDETDNGSLKLLKVKYFDEDFKEINENKNIENESTRGKGNCDKTESNTTSIEDLSLAGTSDNKTLVCDNRKGSNERRKNKKERRKINRVNKRSEEALYDVECSEEENSKKENLLGDTAIALSSEDVKNQTKCIKAETAIFIKQETKYSEQDVFEKKREEKASSSSNVVNEDCDNEDNKKKGTGLKTSNFKSDFNAEEMLDKMEEKRAEVDEIIENDKPDTLMENLDLLELKQNLFVHMSVSPSEPDLMRVPNSSPTLSIEGDSLEPMSEAQGITNALNLKLSDIFNKLSGLEDSEKQMNSWEEELNYENGSNEGCKVSRRDILMKLDTQNSKTRRNWVRPSPQQSERANTSFGELKEHAEDSFLKVPTEGVAEDLPGKFKSANEYLSSPGLSDVSAESLSSSDAEKETSGPAKKRISRFADSFRPGGEIQGTRSEINNSKTPEQSLTNCGQVNTSAASASGGNKNNARYTSLVMITGDIGENTRSGIKNKSGNTRSGVELRDDLKRHVHDNQQVVSVVTSDTTTVVPGEEGKGDLVVVSHTNRDASPVERRGKKGENQMEEDILNQDSESVTVITGEKTLSAFEEGLADDDSWVETSDDEVNTSSSGDEVTLTCSAVVDQEDELRGYHRSAIDFTLHTIVEESCEESEVEQNVRKTNKKQRPMSATELEKYFFFGLGDGMQSSINSNREDTLSETSSIYSEGMESLGKPDEPSNLNDNSSEDLASSRLEKYFLSGFMGFTQERRDSDGSVGSDSEGKPSPEQRRKRLVRARGAGRSHSSSLDNLLAHSEFGTNDQLSENNQIVSEDSSSSDSDTYDELSGFKEDGQFDTVKRKGKSKKCNKASTENLETTQEINENYISDEDDDRNKTPQPELTTIPSNLTTNKQQQSRDSGFVGSCDDLLKDQKDVHVSDFTMIEENEKENTEIEKKEDNKTLTLSVPPNTSLTRRDSFNNWSSDEETNLMMSKMRQFFKTMVANTTNKSTSQPTTPNLSAKTSPKPLPRTKSRCKPPQLVYFENELTRLMKTVPGIRDDQVREIVEYLSSEDTWSDSYDSSDYTSSDLETASNKSALQQQISDSCKQIINKFDHTIEDTEGDLGDGGILDENHGLNKETAFVYQKLVASFEKMATGDKPVNVTSSPPLIAKVMHHIGSRLVALMHEVSSGESHASNSPRMRHYHRRLQQKLSNASSTTTDDDSTDSNLADTFREDKLNLLPRSKSHDLLMGENNKNLQQSREGTNDILEEKEASDCERFSWRGSFESALLASDSRNRLSLISSEHSASASALAIAAKRRSAGDLLFSHKSLSRDQLDRVRSCGSIGGNTPEEKIWVATATKPNRRRLSVPDSGSCGSQDGDNEEDDLEKNENRATLPRSLISGPQSTNSLPRLPTNTAATIQKAQSHHFLSHNVKSARYRPPGFSRLLTTAPKRAVSAPGLQPSHQRRGRRSQPNNVPISDDVSLSEAHSSPMLATRMSKSATPSPVAPATRRKTNSLSSHEWPTARDDDIDRLVVLHHNRSSLSSLGLRSDSMASVYSGAGEGRHGFVTVKGQVEFGLQYNYKAGDLEIQIKQCRDLAPVDTKRNRSDPYVKVYLLPDKSKSGKRKTKVKKHTLNPVFDECLKFHMTINELELRTLWLTVWHSDMFGRNDFLGEVMMALENKVFDDPTPKWYNLQERTEPFDDILSFKGDIIVALKFVPPDMTVHKKGKRSRGALHVLVKEAKALTAVKANGTSDPFVKSYLLPEKGRSSKQKTPVVRRTVNPVWNHNLVYDDVTLQELAERSLELTVWDHDRLASNEFLGGVRFSLGTGKHYGKPVEWMDATGKELNLWKSMLERPNFWVEGCLALRPTLDIRMS